MTDHGPVEQFRARAREWLEANAVKKARDGRGPHGQDPVPTNEQRAFQAKLWKAGLVGITWPRQYGGQGLSNAEQIAFSEVARDFTLPTNVFKIAMGMIGPTLLECGTEQQKRRYVPKILNGEETWCQLFSEPSGGSDVASLLTRAVRRDGGWMLNGQKIWASFAHQSDYGVVLARTDPTVAKHKGITMFILDMCLPGVTVRPLRVATGAMPFNEVFFDDVQLAADTVVGQPNDGWRVALVMLRNERETIGTSATPRGNQLSYDSLSELARSRALTSNEFLRRRLAELYARERATVLFGELLREEAMAGLKPGARGSVGKLANSELGLFAASVAEDLLGPAVVGYDTDEVLALATAIVGAPGGSIAGGTNEIQRNIIGERLLGLPKDPGVDRDTPFNELRVGTQKR
jgi:alkylation response protein AidB-like acyl-CoA dehydrogenase